ncbi:hypothetical protein BJ546DRAFT_434850 [Cryomyces antarcticus]
MRSTGLSAQQGSVVGAVPNLGLGLGVGRPVVEYFRDTVGRMDICYAGDGLLRLSLLRRVAVRKELRRFRCPLRFWLARSVAPFRSTIVPVDAEVVGLEEVLGTLSMLWFRPRARVDLRVPCFHSPLPSALRC